MEQIRQNVIDRGMAMESFLNKRREIIIEMGKIRRAKRQQPDRDKSIILEALQESLVLQLEQITNETEQRLAAIRTRRTGMI